MKSTFLRMMAVVALLATIGCTSKSDTAGSAGSEKAGDSGETASKAGDDSGKTAAVVTPDTPKRPVHPVVDELHPEITGPDTDGEVFSLSDYRGKVVMIDFWGNW